MAIIEPFLYADLVIYCCSANKKKRNGDPERYYNCCSRYALYNALLTIIYIVYEVHGNIENFLNTQKYINSLNLIDCDDTTVTD